LKFAWPEFLSVSRRPLPRSSAKPSRFGVWPKLQLERGGYRYRYRYRLPLLFIVVAVVNTIEGRYRTFRLHIKQQ
jgi:hypothetical protein